MLGVEGRLRDWVFVSAHPDVFEPAQCPDTPKEQESSYKNVLKVLSKVLLKIM